MSFFAFMLMFLNVRSSNYYQSTIFISIDRQTYIKPKQVIIKKKKYLVYKSYKKYAKI